jgi:very-short-patch-repair endonuclease
VRLQTITLKRARRLRQSLSPPEVALWAALKGQKLDGYAFRRQHPVEPYILDFYCEAARLAVEVDGAGHQAPDDARYDLRRDAFLRERGIEVIRLSASFVLRDRAAALATILDEVRRRAPSVAPRQLPRERGST